MEIHGNIDIYNLELRKRIAFFNPLQKSKWQARTMRKQRRTKSTKFEP